MEKASQFRRVMLVVCVALGVGFSISSLAIDLQVEARVLDWKNISHLFIQSSVHWMILAMAVCMAGVIYFLVDNMMFHEQDLYEQIEDQEKRIREVGLVMENFDYESVPTITLLKDPLICSLLEKKEKYHQTLESDQEKDWILDGQRELDLILNLESESNILEVFLSFVSRYVGYQQSLLFLVNDDNETISLIKLYDGSAVVDPSQELILKKGIGMVGQCFENKAEIFLDDVPSAYLQRNLGVDNSSKYLAIFPIIKDEKVEGIIEMGGTAKLHQVEIAFLKHACEKLSMVFNSHRLNQLAKKRVQETQEFANKIRLEEEKIKSTVSELIAQREELIEKEKAYKIKIDNLELANADFQRQHWELQNQLNHLKKVTHDPN